MNIFDRYIETSTPGQLLFDFVLFGVLVWMGVFWWVVK